MVSLLLDGHVSGAVLRDHGRGVQDDAALLIQSGQGFCRAAREDGAPVDVRVTWEGDDASRFALEAAQAGYEIVVAGGGDGTVKQGADIKGPEASPSFRSARPTTAAQACGIPLDPDAAMRLAVSGPTSIVDVGQANGRRFVNVATGGFGTQVTVATPSELKRILGGAAYLLTGLTHFSGIQAQARTPVGARLRVGRGFPRLAVGSGRQAGGGHQLCPEAMLDDGLLDVRVLPQLPKEEIPEALRILLRDGFEGLRRALVGARVPWFEVETEESLQINLDGEPLTATRFRFELLPRRLSMKLPAGCPLLS